MNAFLLKIVKALVVLIVVIFIALFIQATDFRQVVKALHRVGAGYLLVLISTFCAYLLATLGWQCCLDKTTTGIPLWKLFMVRHVGETVSLFNPASIIGGDILKVALLQKDRAGSDELVCSVFTSRLMMILSQVLLLFITLIWLLLTTEGHPEFAGAVWAVVVVLCAMLAVGCYYFLARPVALSGRAAKGVLSRFLMKVRNMRAGAVSFYRHRPGAFVSAFVFFTLHWVAGSVEFYIIIRLLGYDISMIHALLLDMGVIFIKSAGAFIPGQLGIEEAGNRIMLLLAGIGGTAVWLAVSVLRRSRQLVWLLAAAVFYLLLKNTNGTFICKSQVPAIYRRNGKTEL